MSDLRVTKLFVVLVGVLLMAVAVQAAFAAGDYWRWTAPSGYECGADGDDYLDTGTLYYEFSLPASGAVISQYVSSNGVSSYVGDITGLSGSGSGSESGSFVHGSDPFTYALQRDTMVDGKLVYRSTLTYVCTYLGEGTDVTATIVNEAFGDGEAVCLPLPVGSVVGALPNDQVAFYAPGKITVPNVVVNAGTYWVLGQDESGGYYKILIACQYLWVPVESLQPSYQAPWTGQPLPTQVVS